MTRDEFLGLPPSVALRVLLDAFPSLEQKLAAVPKPTPIRKPKYDFAIFRKEGVAWASECDRENLTFWRDRYAESAAKGGEYAAKDAKRVKTLDAWIAWRQVEPSTPWTGERNDEAIIAPPPSGNPRVHPRRNRAASSDGGGGDSAPNNDANNESAEDFRF